MSTQVGQFKQGLLHVPLTLAGIVLAGTLPRLGLGLDGVPEGLKNLDVLVVLGQFLLSHLDGGHEPAVRTRLEVELDVVLIKFSEFRSAQFGTNFLLTYYNTWCCRRKRRPCTRPPAPLQSGAPDPPSSAITYEGRPPRIPPDLGPKHLLLLEQGFIVVLLARHTTQ